MSERRSRTWLVAEVLLLMIPISILLLLGLSAFLVFYYGFSFGSSAPYTICLLVLGACALSVVCLWRIVFCRYGGGVAGLRRLPFVWWAGAVLGALITVAALASSFLVPPSPPYSALAEVRGLFDILVFGFPLIVPLVHLGCEALFGESNKSAEGNGVAQHASVASA